MKIDIGKLPQYLLYRLRYKEYNHFNFSKTSSDKQNNVSFANHSKVILIWLWVIVGVLSEERDSIFSVLSKLSSENLL